MSFTVKVRVLVDGKEGATSVSTWPEPGDGAVFTVNYAGGRIQAHVDRLEEVEVKTVCVLKDGDVR